PPRQVRPVNVVAGDPHEPVAGRAEPLDEVPLPVDDDALEHRAALAVAQAHLDPGGGPGQQIDDGPIETGHAPQRRSRPPAVGADQSSRTAATTCSSALRLW